jgi:hypothetical protein
VHGKPWSAHTLLVSLLLNALSFFFMMRWRRALPLFLGFVFLSVGVGFALNRDYIPEGIKLVVLGAVFVGPFAINSVVLLRHEVALKTCVSVKA